jgi:hypothetical protein
MARANEPDYSELNAYMREQRHQARANKARAEAAERGDEPPPPPPRREVVDVSPVARRRGGGEVPDYSEINAYMREQRHAARANKARQEGADQGNRFGRDEDWVAPPERPRQAPVDDYMELNAYMREQRHQACANTERAQAEERRNAIWDDVPESVPQQRAGGERRQEAAQSDYTEINAYMREQRHQARANKARAQASEHNTHI